MYHTRRAALNQELTLIRASIKTLRSICPTDSFDKVRILQEINRLLLKQNEMIRLRHLMITERLMDINSCLGMNQQKIA